jgi:hypothetical protein
MLKAILTQRSWLHRMLILGLVIVTVIIIYLYLLRSKSIVYRLVESGNPDHEPAVSIFNPFRDRQPEKCAQNFLELLKAGQCERAMAGVPVNTEYRRIVCEKEGAYNLEGWSLKNRTDQPQKVDMYYLVKRKNYDDLEGQVWVTVEQRDSQWQVTYYESRY